MRNIKITALIITFYLLSLPMVSAQKLSISTIESKIDSLFQPYQNEPGIAIGIVKDGKVVYKKGVGIANMDYGIGITPNTVFEVGSMGMQILITPPYSRI